MKFNLVLASLAISAVGISAIPVPQAEDPNVLASLIPVLTTALGPLGASLAPLLIALGGTTNTVQALLNQLGYTTNTLGGGPDAPGAPSSGSTPSIPAGAANASSSDDSIPIVGSLLSGASSA